MADSLRLWQLISPALPVGAFAWSGGLESAVDCGWVHDRYTAQSWIAGVLSDSLSYNDLPLLRRLQQAWSALSEADGAEAEASARAELGRCNGLLVALRDTAELRDEDRQLGAALTRLLIDLGLPEAERLRESPVSPPAFATAWALAACHWQIDPEAALRGYAFAWVENQVSAAVKLVPLGQTDGQRLLGSLLPKIDSAAGTALALPEAQIGASLPGVALASSWHETQYSRLFRS